MKDVTTMISSVLVKLKVSQHRVGFKYLRDVITALNNGECTRLWDAYTIVAEKYAVTIVAVEHGCRKACREAIANSTSKAKIDVFGFDITKENKMGRDYFKTGEFVLYILSYINSKKK